jgi:L-lactate permease
MISPQSITVATAASGLVDKEGDLFSFAVKHSLLLAIISRCHYIYTSILVKLDDSVG